MSKPLFKLGQILATPAALEALQRNNQTVAELLQLHAVGKWGIVGSEDAEANSQSLKDGSRLLSVYLLRDGKTKVWIITEAEDDDGNRACSTCLLPSDY